MGPVFATLFPSQKALSLISRFSSHELACDLVLPAHLRHDDEQDAVQRPEVPLPYFDHSGMLWKRVSTC